MDLFLLNKIEKLGHRFQLLTGKTNFFLSMILSLVLIVFVVVYSFAVNFKLNSIDLFFLLILSGRVVIYHHMEHEAINRISNGCSNPAKIIPRDKFFRKIVVVCTILNFTLLYWAAVLIFIFYGLTLYLDACDPLPPCRGKIGETIDAFFAPKLVPIPIKESGK